METAIYKQRKLAYDLMLNQSDGDADMTMWDDTMAAESWTAGIKVSTSIELKSQDWCMKLYTQCRGIVI